MGFQDVNINEEMVKRQFAVRDGLSPANKQEQGTVYNDDWKWIVITAQTLVLDEYDLDLLHLTVSKKTFSKN